MSFLLEQGAVFQRTIIVVLSCSLAVLGALIVHRVAYGIAHRFSRRTSSIFDDSLLRHSEKPARAIFPLLTLLSVSPGLGLSDVGAAHFRHAVGLGLIASTGWLLVSLLRVFEDVLGVRYRIDVEDNLRARRVQTQVSVLQRIVTVVIVIITLSVMLMTFPSVRQVGQSLFASAGIAALVAGLAARSTFSSLIAGLQIALTEPIRLDDVVIVEGEWGRVEKITTTYVVVRIWDERRMVVPLSKFIEEPFQNWTMTGANLLGTVFLYVDYSVPVDAVREELHRILEGSPLWDRRAWALQVTDATERTLQLRALMSAANSGTAFDLRCLVREKLIAFLQANYPESLPRTRAEIQGVLTGAEEERERRAS
ncbi:MAG TPA: mechanosensitive ion channel domain-containing protein [Terriglobales bacterium]|nr:mechanosensitive ion channel domain-containing protein [Terriglobales bacterium]